MQRGWPLLGPLQWTRFVNARVRVTAGRGEERRGWLLTVDPVSASLVLVDFGVGGRACVQVVMGHAVHDVHVLQEADDETTQRLQASFLPPPETRSLDPEERRRRRTGVRSWLQQNRVPVEEDGDELRVAGVLTVSAPYGPDDCRSDNQIVLDRIQKLILQGGVQLQPDQPETEPA